ncbi:YitT family protein [Salimicrobium sp. PL1-032A]|uniref:YczE/YyaS/YitT family protein n=1 Tax=Salimicrobium sp. PL1-032A TaxID=3095364 RepID=UPI003260FB24
MVYLLLALIYTAGLLVSSLGLALIIKSNLGAGPGDSIAVGLSYHTPVTVGTFMIIAFAILVIVNAIVEKKRPQYESLIPSIIRGRTLDIFLYGSLENVNPETWYMQALIFTVGIIATAVGISFYLRTPFPRIPLDHFMMVMNTKTKQSKGVVRNLMEGAMALTGYLLGGPVGVGTVLVVFLLGPLIQWSFPLARPVAFLWTDPKKARDAE